MGASMCECVRLLHYQNYFASVNKQKFSATGRKFRTRALNGLSELKLEKSQIFGMRVGSSSSLLLLLYIFFFLPPNAEGKCAS